MFTIEASQLLWLIIFGILAHALWILLSLKFHALYLVGTVFLLVAPFSVALDAAAIIVALKYARIYSGFLLAITGLFMLLRENRFGRLCGAFLLFYLLLFAGSFYSDYPSLSIMYKTIGLSVLLGGMCIGLVSGTSPQFASSLRVLLVPSIVYAVMFLAAAAHDPGKFGRLAAFGMNPNYVGFTVAACVPIALYIALFDRMKSLRIVAWATTFALILVLLFTGSRASFGATMIASALLLAPFVRRPGVLLLLGLFVTIVMWYLLDRINISGAGRVLDIEQNTRAAIWHDSLEAWRRSPIIGNGTLFNVTRMARPIWGNTHSIYIQVLCETGIVGGMMFAIALIYAGVQSVRVWTRSASSEKWLAYALLAVPLAVGLFESGPLMGSGAPTLMWGMGLGLLDRLIASERTETEYQAMPEELGWSTTTYS